MFLQKTSVLALYSTYEIKYKTFVVSICIETYNKISYNRFFASIARGRLLSICC